MNLIKSFLLISTLAIVFLCVNCQSEMCRNTLIRKAREAVLHDRKIRSPSPCLSYVEYPPGWHNRIRKRPTPPKRPGGYALSIDDIDPDEWEIRKLRFSPLPEAKVNMKKPA
ncbi:uncharacterized protein LOC141533952 [Cotesia typhae]|uniref:uncharacterized protein LOC141533952 n=1 Tax=Cotesia typhae TaxID=2053667 RepID=UPI003D6957B7